MTNPEHLARLTREIRAWNEWRQENQSLVPRLARADLLKADLQGANLSRGDLHEAILYWAKLSGADLHEANLSRAKLRGASLSDANLHGARLLSADLHEAILIRADLSGAILRDAEILKADLSRANLSGADLDGANLGGANLREACLRVANLSRASLRGADLLGADLNRAGLFRADLRGVYLTSANLREADLTEADLSGTSLRKADLSMAKFGGANLSGADLAGANLFQATLACADLSKATLGNTSFVNTNLRTAVGLDSCHHEGPSFLDYYTLAISGPLPIGFLRGCGLSDQFIEYLPSLLAQAIQFYSCFISYSTRDKEFAERLYADLQNKAVRCWYAPEDLKIGDKFQDRIEESIRFHDKLLLVLTESSINSPWVEDEVQAALERERRDGKLVMFPVRLDDAVMDTSKSWAANLRRTRHIGDFTRWKNHDSYQASLNRLLRDLKAETRPIQPSPASNV